MFNNVKFRFDGDIINQKSTSNEVNTLCSQCNFYDIFSYAYSFNYTAGNGEL